MGARPYDPTLGRFLAVDPIDGGSLNNYDYAGQDPINGYDLSGTVLAKEDGGSDHSEVVNPDGSVTLSGITVITDLEGNVVSIDAFSITVLPTARGFTVSTAVSTISGRSVTGGDVDVSDPQCGPDVCFGVKANTSESGGGTYADVQTIVMGNGRSTFDVGLTLDFGSAGKAAIYGPDGDTLLSFAVSCKGLACSVHAG